MMVHSQTTELRSLLRNQTFLHMPSVYDAIGGRLVQSLRFEAVYVGGYVTGGASPGTEAPFTKNQRGPATRRSPPAGRISFDFLPVASLCRPPDHRRHHPGARHPP